MPGTRRPQAGGNRPIDAAQVVHGSRIKPFISVYARLPQYSLQKIRAYLSPVRIRNRESQIGFEHERCLPPP